MKHNRITVHSADETHYIIRKPFDFVETVYDGVKVLQCWVRYRGGRMFVRSIGNKPWKPFRFEKNGKANFSVLF